MLEKMVRVLILWGLTSVAWADQWVAGADFNTLGGLNAVSGSISYVVPVVNEQQRVLVGGRYGLGLDDDNGLELDSMLGFFGKYQYELSQDWYVHAMLAWTDFDYSVEYSYLGSSYSVSGSDSEVSIGGGGGYRIDEQSSIEVALELFDREDSISVGYRYHF